MNSRQSNIWNSSMNPQNGAWPMISYKYNWNIPAAAQEFYPCTLPKWDDILSTSGYGSHMAPIWLPNTKKNTNHNKTPFLSDSWWPELAQQRITQLSCKLCKLHLDLADPQKNSKPSHWNQIAVVATCQVVPSQLGSATVRAEANLRRDGQASGPRQLELNIVGKC